MSLHEKSKVSHQPLCCRVNSLIGRLRTYMVIKTENHVSDCLIWLRISNVGIIMSQYPYSFQVHRGVYIIIIVHGHGSVHSLFDNDLYFDNGILRSKWSIIYLNLISKLIYVSFLLIWQSDIVFLRYS
jgi:hypothetical protein